MAINLQVAKHQNESGLDEAASGWRDEANRGSSNIWLEGLEEAKRYAVIGAQSVESRRVVI